MNASYEGLGPDNGSYCDDGYPADPIAPTTYGGIGQSQSGTHYVGPFTPDKNNSVVVTLTAASAGGAANPHPSTKNDSNAGVGFLVTCYAIEMTTTGTTSIAGVDQIIVGQPFTATVTTGGLPSSGDTYAWTAPSPGGSGAPFTNYQASLASAAVTLFTDPTTSSLACFFSAASTGLTPSCKYHCGVLDADITVTRQHPILVMSPTINDPHTGCGTMNLLSGPPWALNSTNPTAFELWGDEYAGTTTGTIYVAWVADPSGFGSTPGKYGYVQILEGTGYSSWTLDTAFPYPNVGGWYSSPSNNSALTVWDDQPGFTNLRAYSDRTFDTAFQMYVFYMPPGSGAVYVPLKCIKWFADGEYTYAAPNTWTQQDLGSELGNQVVPVPPGSFPTWTSVTQ